MFAKLRNLERRVASTLEKLKSDQSKLSNMRIKWKNLPDKTKLNKDFSDFVIKKVNSLKVMFDQIYE